MSECAFCAIVDGTAPASAVYQDNTVSVIVAAPLGEADRRGV